MRNKTGYQHKQRRDGHKVCRMDGKTFETVSSTNKRDLVCVNGHTDGHITIVR